jgi:hypothetical protein
VRRSNLRGAIGYSVLVLVSLFAVVACGSSARTAAPNSRTATTAPAAPAVGGARAGLRAVGVAGAKAYLTGTPEAMAALQGPQCVGSGLTASNRHIAIAELQQMRAAMQAHLGVAPRDVKIRGVLIRNMTATSGEAQVEYALPQTAAGNDNWVAYELDRGQWKVADCHAPIGGSGSSGSATPPTTAR